MNKEQKLKKLIDKRAIGQFPGLFTRREVEEIAGEYAQYIETQTLKKQKLNLKQTKTIHK